MNEKSVINPLYFTKPDERVCPLYFTKTGEEIDPFYFVEINSALQEKQEIDDTKSITGWQNVVPMVQQEKSDTNSTSEEKMTLPMLLSKQFDMANFYVKPICKNIYLDRNGNEIHKRETIDCIIFINRDSHRLTVKTSDISCMSTIVTKRFADAMIDFEEKNAKKIIEAQFRQDVRFCKKKYVYCQAGWQLVGTHMLYMRDGIDLGSGRVAETRMTLPAYPWGSEMILQVFHAACNMYRNKTSMYTMLVHSLMGVLHRPFKEAGYPPHFALFLNGKTGSLKTTIGKILFVQLCEEEFRDKPRRVDSDTAVSLERGIVASGYDTVTLIDDYSPAKTDAKRHEMQDKLEMVIRMVGDGISRSRGDKDLQDRRGEGVHGMVVLTGELMGKGVSSNLRCLYCKMQREYVDIGTVSWFQEHPYAFTSFIATFSDFVGQNYDIIKKYIAENFIQERKKVSGALKEWRLVDSAATLCIACDVLRNFLVIYGGMESKTADEITNTMKIEIINCTAISEALSTEESPTIAFVQTIASLMRMNKIVLSAEKVTTSNSTEYDGFADGDFFYFNPDSVHKKVVTFMRQTNGYFPFEVNEILVMLAEDKIIKTAPNGAGKRTFCVRIPVGHGVRHKFLKIRRSIFDAIVEGNFDYDQGERE